MGRYVNSGRYAYFFLVKVRIGMVIWVGMFIRNFRVTVYKLDRNVVYGYSGVFRNLN